MLYISLYNLVVLSFELRGWLMERIYFQFYFILSFPSNYVFWGQEYFVVSGNGWLSGNVGYQIKSGSIILNHYCDGYSWCSVYKSLMRGENNHIKFWSSCQP